MRWRKVLFLLFVCFFLALSSLRAQDTPSLSSQARELLQVIRTNNESLRASIATLESQLLTEQQTLIDLRVSQTASEQKLSEQEKIIDDLKWQIENDKESLKRQESLLKDQMTQYQNLSLSLTLSQSLNKWLTISVCILVPAVVVETILLFRK